MSNSSGMFGSAGAMPQAVMDGSQSASFNSRTDPKTNSLYDFLGTPNRHSPIDGSSRRPRTNKTLVDAYEGVNAFVSDTVSISITKNLWKEKKCG
jgi:hypothetical protein